VSVVTIMPTRGKSTQGNHPSDRGGRTQRPLGESSEVLAGERETITALFADIKGSMELIEGLGPEEALAIVDPALKLMMAFTAMSPGPMRSSGRTWLRRLLLRPAPSRGHPTHRQRGLPHARASDQRPIRRSRRCRQDPFRLRRSPPRPFRSPRFPRAFMRALDVLALNDEELARFPARG
jgi:hypothetical protein